MTTISTGSVSSSGGSTYISSLASGLDTEALVEAAVAQQTKKADAIDARIDANGEKIAAYENIQSLITAMVDALEPLAGTTYSVLGADNAFDARQAYLSGASTANTITASVGAEAATGAYTIEVTQLAAAMKVAGDTLSGEALGLSGRFQLGVAGADVVDIDISADMDINDIAERINAMSETSGVAASVVRTGAGAYRLVLTGQDMGVALNALDVSGAVLQGLGLIDAEGSFRDVRQEPAVAKFTLDGVAIESDSNDVDHVLPGLSLTLLSVTTEAVTLTIEPDYEGVKTAISAFVDAYNALREALNTQQQVNADGSLPDDVVLFADGALRTLSSMLSSNVALGREGEIGALAQLGIKLDSAGYLSIEDDTNLDDALLKQLGDIAQFFATDFTASDEDLRLLRNETTASLDFSLEIEVEAGAVTQILVDGKAGLFTLESGGRIVGAKNSIYEGLSFAYGGDESAVVNISLRQGFANSLINSAKAVSDQTIDAQIERLRDADTQLSAEADRIRDDAEAYRTRMVEKYARMEAAVQAAELLLQQLEAILNSGDDDA